MTKDQCHSELVSESFTEKPARLDGCCNLLKPASRAGQVQLHTRQWMHFSDAKSSSACYDSLLHSYLKQKAPPESDEALSARTVNFLQSNPQRKILNVLQAPVICKAVIDFEGDGVFNCVVHAESPRKSLFGVAEEKRFVSGAGEQNFTP